MIEHVLTYIRDQRQQIPKENDDDELFVKGYSRGYRTALNELEEFILDELWEEGVDDAEA